MRFFKSPPTTTSEERWAMFNHINDILQPHVKRLTDHSRKDGRSLEVRDSDRSLGIGIELGLECLCVALQLKDSQEGKTSPSFTGKTYYHASQLDPKQIKRADFSTMQAMLCIEFRIWSSTSAEVSVSYGGEDYDSPIVPGFRTGSSLRDRLNDYNWFGKTKFLLEIEEALQKIELTRSAAPVDGAAAGGAGTDLAFAGDEIARAALGRRT